MSTTRRAAIVQRMPKVQAEFEAWFADTVRAEAYRALKMLLRIVCGTASPAPARFAALLPCAMQAERSRDAA